MANGYFERGEVYWVRLDSGIGAEKGFGRPGVIVSADFLNNSSDLVSVAMTTTKNNGNYMWNVQNEATDRTSWVQCNQVMSYDKSRLSTCIGKLNSAEMQAVDDALEKVFDLGYIDDSAVKEKEAEIAALKLQLKEQQEEIAKLNAHIDSHADEDMAKKVEIEMWQRLYEKALDQVCSMKLTGDVTRRTEKSSPPVKPAEPKTEDSPKLVDINSCKFTELKKIGLSDNIAMTIVNRRPYKNISDLKNLPGLTSVKYKLIENKIFCSAVKKPIVSALPEADLGYDPPEKVNINTAKAAEIKEALGCGINAAYAITRHRKTNGLITSLEELASLPFWTKSLLAKYRDKMEV